MDHDKITVDEHSLKGLRKIRNIVVDTKDLMTLVTGDKSPASIIDAYAALLQERVEASGGSEWCVFSSRLGPLVAGENPEGSVYGTIEEHILAACPTPDTPEALLSKTRWLIPLCGGRVPHWILGWVNFTNGEVGLFDSIPELASSFWAEPRLILVVDKIMEYLKAKPVKWNEGRWERKLYSPAPLKRQFDTWSCGLFVLMALECYVKIGNINRKGPDVQWGEVGDDKKYNMCKQVLEELLELPSQHSNAGDDADSDFEVIQTGEFTFETRARKSRKASVDIGFPSAVSEISANAPACTLGANSCALDDIDGSHPGEGGGTELREIEKSISEASSSIPAGVKRPLAISNANDDTDTDEENARTRRSKAAKQPRRAKLSEKARHDVLEDDEWTNEVEAHRVRCAGCHKWLALHSRRKYVIHNWRNHKDVCSQITGFSTRRIRLVKTPRNNQAPQGVKSIATFFQPTSRSHNGEDHIQEHLTEQPTPDNGRYATEIIRVTPSIRAIFSSVDASLPRLSETLELQPVMCRHLSSPEYHEYITRCKTRTLGGISFEFRARLARQLTPWKKHPPMTETRTRFRNEIPIPSGVKIEVPEDGNTAVKFVSWTNSEKKRLDNHLLAWARWEVDFTNGFVRSTTCEKTTSNSSGVCDACETVAHDDAFKKALWRKNTESHLPQDEQHRIHTQREKYTPKTLLSTESRKLQEQLKDPLIFAVWNDLQRGTEGDVFLRLYQQIREGKLKNYETFVGVCEVLTDQISRGTSSNPNLKYGIRYPEKYLNFMTLLRSYGTNSARQFGLITGALGGPSFRTMRTLVANSDDALRNPALIFENVARVKRFVVARKYTGPIAVAGDCTKVRARLSYSNDFGSHILGSTLPLNECEVDDINDIDEIIDRIKKKQVMATQVRAILVKIPLPQYPPLVVALIPTNGKESAEEIHEQHMQFLKMAARLELPVISFAADGAASELAAQNLMDKETTEQPHLSYEYRLYGVSLRVPVFSVTGPCISITDPPHGRKTSRNQPQHGTKTASLGVGHLVNRSLIDLCGIPDSGLMVRDVKDVDKQDDGAARRLFHTTALTALTVKDMKADGPQIRDGFHGLFVYLFIFGTLFDAWMSRQMSVEDRVLCAFRARFWLHLWRQHIVNMARRFPDLYSLKRSFISPASFNIFNRLCDTLVELALAYSHYYPDQPFCPWLLGTDFVEHFYGVARVLLPNFTFAEFLKIVQHVMIRQRILLSGDYNEKREKSSAVGYIMDYDSKPLSSAEQCAIKSCLTSFDLNDIIVVAYKDASRICKDILCISVASITDQKPLQLVHLGFTLTRTTSRTDRTTSNSTESESDDESDDDDEDGDDHGGAMGVVESGEDMDLAETTAAAARDAARYAALCDDLETATADLEKAEAASASNQLASQPIGPVRPSSTSSSPHIHPIQSNILDASGKANIGMMLKARARLQSGTTVKSERIVKLNPKFDQLCEEDGKHGKAKKLSSQEAAHRLRIAQDAALVGIKAPKKMRELRWQSSMKDLQQIITEKELPNLPSRNVNSLNPLKPGCFIIARTALRTFVGEVLDIYKVAASSRYGTLEVATSASNVSALSLRVFLPLGVTGAGEDDDSMNDSDGSDSSTHSQSAAPTFSCYLSTSSQSQIHTYALAPQLLYNLGMFALTRQSTKTNWALTPVAAQRWLSLTKPQVRKILPKIRIPGGRMVPKQT